MKAIKILLVAVLVLLIAIQFMPSGMPENIPEDDHALANSGLADENVLTILRTSCFDCHSNQTHFPWYARVAPASLFLAGHIKEGREHMNFSEWENYSKREKIGMLEEISDEVKAGEMPLKSYLVIHRDAILDENKVKILTDWTNEATEKLLE